MEGYDADILSMGYLACGYTFADSRNLCDLRNGASCLFYQMEWHLTSFQTGLIVSAVNIGPIFSMLLFGYLMDKREKSRLLDGARYYWACQPYC